MRQSHVAHAQLVEGAQDGQAAVQGVPALHANEAGYTPSAEGVLNTCGGASISHEFLPGRHAEK